MTTLSPTVGGAAGRPGPGRPRDPQVDTAVTAAVFELLAEVGYARLSITAVAQRAGVGKPAIYRRWRNKPEMVVDVLARAAAATIPAPDTGSVRSDLRAIFGQKLSLHRLNAGRLQLALLADLPFDADLAAVYREQFVKPRRANLRAVLERGIARGELRDDVDLDLLCDIGAAVFQHRVMVTGDPIDEGLVDRLIDLMLRGAGR